jgi:hypothetical protein
MFIYPLDSLFYTIISKKIRLVKGKKWEVEGLNGVSEKLLREDLS